MMMVMMMMTLIQDPVWSHAETVKSHHSVPQGPTHSKDLPLRVSVAGCTETNLHDQRLQGKRRDVLSWTQLNVAAVKIS